MIDLRPACAGDVDAIVEIFKSARAAALPSLPVLHTDDEHRAFFGGHVTRGAATVALDRDRIVGFIVLGAGRVEHLYVDPFAQRRGIGSMLLRHAQDRCADGLDLWLFQRNRAAIGFYEQHGFTIAEMTDGAGNEEREPDARMAWPDPGSAHTTPDRRRV